MQQFLLACLASVSMAVKTHVENQVTSFAQATSMSLQEVNEDVLSFDLSTIDDWYGDVYTPVLTAHADDISKQIYENLVATEPQLLEVCGEGVQCREDVKKWVQSQIKEKWTSVLQQIQSSIETTTVQMQDIMKEGWDKEVQCEIDHPCCKVSEVTWNNNVTSVNRIRQLIIQKYKKWEEFEKRRLEIEEECPYNDYLTCDKLPPCWDGSERADDADCSCPAFVYPQCPVTTCEGSTLPPNPETCECGVVRTPIIHWLPTIGPENDHIDLHTSTTFKQTDMPEIKNYDNPIIKICTDNDECKMQFYWLDGSVSGPDLTANPTCYNITDEVKNVEVGYYHVRASYYEDQMYLSSMQFNDANGNKLWRSQSCDWDDFTDPNLGYRNSFLNFDLEEGDRLVGFISNYYIPEGADGMYNFHWSVGSLPEDN